MSDPAEGLRDSAVFNLTSAVTMVVDDSAFGLDLTCVALRGFGINPRHLCTSAADAIAILTEHPVDLILVDCEMPGMDGHELVRWLRNSGLDPNAYVPVIMTAAHVRASKVSSVRDCGANFLVTKPFSAASLLQRLVWVARDSRPFLEAGNYQGPDRRFNASRARAEDERRAEMIALAIHEEEAAEAARAAADAKETAA